MSLSCSAAPMPFVTGGIPVATPPLTTYAAPSVQQFGAYGGGPVAQPAFVAAPVVSPGTIQLPAQSYIVQPQPQASYVAGGPVSPTDIAAQANQAQLQSILPQLQAQLAQQQQAQSIPVAAPPANAQPANPAATSAPFGANGLQQAQISAQAAGGGASSADLTSLLSGLQQAISSLTQLVQQLAQRTAAGGGASSTSPASNAGGGASSASSSCCGSSASSDAPSSALPSDYGQSYAQTPPLDPSSTPASSAPASSDAPLQDLPPIPGTPGTQAPASTLSAGAAVPVSSTNADGSTNWEQEAKNAASAVGLDPEIFARQIKQESGFNPNAGSPAGAQGIAQIMPDTAKAWGVDPHDPKAALKAAAEHMKQYVDKYGGDYAKALAAYNAGEGAVAKYNGVPPFAETQNYVKVILQQ